MNQELSGDQRNELADYVGRIESLTAERAEAAEKIKAEYAAAAGAGYDKKAIRQLIKERASDLEKTIEHRKIVETYRKALGGLAGTPLGDWARKWMADEARYERRTSEASPMSDWMRQQRGARDAGGEQRPE